MKPEDKKKLNDKRLYLVSNIHLNPNFWAALREDRTIMEEHEQRIMKEYPTNSGRVHKLLDVLPKRGPNAFQSFLKALICSDNEFVAIELDPRRSEEITISLNEDSSASQISNPNEPRVEFLPNSLPVPCQPGSSSIGAAVTLEEELEKIKNIVNSKVPFLDLEVKYEEKSYQDGYKMNHIPRGKVLIFSMNTVEGQNERKGGNIDVINVQNLFLKMGYCVEVCEDLTSVKIKEKIDVESQNKDVDEYDALVIFAMSHGFSKSSETILYAKDGNIVKIGEDIVNKFDGKNCKKLEGKPKLFFFQCCRKNYGRDAASNVTEESIKIHARADIFIAHSTVCGDRSARIPSCGAWFIRALVCVFSFYCHEKSLLWMMTYVQRVVSEMEDPKHKQVAEKTDTMTKQFYFSPVEVPKLINESKKLA